MNHISLCAGYGGIDLGLSKALPRLKTVAYSEIECFPIANLLSKIEHGLLDPAPIWTDLKTFPFVSFKGKVDVLSGGFPCQPFSISGKRNADEDPRHLFPYILKGIEDMDCPSIVFFENVQNILASELKGDHWRDPAGTPILMHIFRELERLGYDCAAQVVSARELGASHNRQRVFIMGVHHQLTNASREAVTSQMQNVEPRPWPQKRQLDQFDWEPSRITGNARSHHFGNDYVELCQDYVDLRLEIKLLGNGVVPDCATRAFNLLWSELGAS